MPQRLSRRVLLGPVCTWCGRYPHHALAPFPALALTTDIGWLLPSCLECHSISNELLKFVFDEQCKLIKAYIKNKYPEENLKQRKTSWLIKRKQLLARLAWNAEKYLQQLDPSGNFAQQLAEIEAFSKRESLNSHSFARLWTNWHHGETEILGHADARVPSPRYPMAR